MIRTVMICTVLFLTILLAGCSAIPQTETPIKPPELVKSARLPPILSVVPGEGMRFNVKILVLKDGTVGDVKLLESSGDAEWDSLALHSIMKWQFVPARADGRPMDVWVRQPLVVQLRDPIIRVLDGLVSATEHEADSLYSLVEHGMDFDSLLRQAVQVSGERGRALGAVDISVYAPPLRDELLRLREGEVSRPLRFGDGFILYKRLKKDPA
jgi:TonB family protein